MNWLKQLQNEMEEITQTAAYAFFPPIGSYTKPYYNLRLEHTKQVEKEALKLLATHSSADSDIVLASVWIHDRCKPQFDGASHGNKAADWTLHNLENKGFPKHKVNAVEYAVRNHTGFTKKQLSTLESQILWDADKLAHYGPSYFFQYFFIFTSEIICNRETSFDIKFNETISVDNLMPAIIRMKHDLDHSAPNPFHLEESRRIYKEKVEAVNVFLEAMQKQL